MFLSLGAALAVAAALVRIPGRVRPVAIAAVALLASVRTFDAQSKWGSSILMWERAVESDPANGMSWSLYAEALSSVGRPDLAEAAVAEGLRHTSSPRLLHRRAMLMLERGDRAGGLAVLQTAAEAGEPRAMANLALLELEAGRPGDATAWARRGAAKEPFLAHTRRTAGKVALAAGRPGEALAEFRAALDLEAGAANRINLALALLGLRRPAEAIPLLEAAAGDPVYGGRARRVLDEARRVQ
jgi:tetratricopeptide (TPR) repeat protein